MSKDKALCMNGKLDKYRGLSGDELEYLGEAAAKAFKRGEVSMHGLANSATGRGLADIFDSMRSNKFMEGAEKLFSRVFNPVNKKTGQEHGFMFHDLVNFFRMPEDMLGKVTTKGYDIDGSGTKVPSSLPQRIRREVEKYFADEKNSRTDPSAFIKNIRPLLQEAVIDFNDKFPVNQAREMARSGKYDTVAEALVELLPEDFKTVSVANQLISLKNYLDGYVKYWENGGDVFKVESRNPILRVMTTASGTIINSDVMISLYNFNEMHKGLAYALDQTGSFKDALEVFNQTLVETYKDGLFKENAAFAKEFSTLYSRPNQLPRPDNAYGKALSKWENLLGKSDTMLRTFYYRLGKNLSQKVSGIDSVDLGKKAVSDNIYIFDIANKPVYLAGDVGSLAYNMMRFFVGQTVQIAGYAKKAIVNKDKTAFKALATELGLFYSIYGLQGTMASLPVAVMGEMMFGKDEWKDLSEQIDKEVVFLDLNDKVLTYASKLVGGEDINTSFRTTAIGTPYLGVGLSRINSAVQTMGQDIRKLGQAIKFGDATGAAVLASDFATTALLFSPSLGSGILNDSVKAFKDAYTGKDYVPNQTKFTWLELLDEGQQSILGDKPD